MTSKREYLEWQLGVANEEQDRKLIKSIIKDLEVLEILKKLPFEIYQNQNNSVGSWSLYIDTNGDGDNYSWYIETKQSIEISEEEYEKIKEWLENDK